MGLQPLEFGDCLTDSPFFRERLHEHEKELDRTSKAIKNLIQHGNKVLDAAKQLSVAQKQFAKDLTDFNFETINNQQTDDERIIARSLREFGKIIISIEDERQVMLDLASQQFVKPLETFRKENIGAAKEEKKIFDKQTTKFCQSLERYLNMKNKVNESTQKEADATLEMERRGFYQASMKYVLKLHEVQEKKKFEFVEILLGFMYSWLTFYHQGHEAAQEFKPFMNDCQYRLQKTRESFESTKEQAEQLMNKMLEVRGMGQNMSAMKPMDQTGTIKGFTRQGYLYLMERKALGTTWTKYYCQYKKDTKEFVMILYNQLGGKVSPPEKMILDQCIRRASESIEKRFCFDVMVKEKQVTMTFQALSEEDRRLWLDAMDGKEPIYNPPTSKSEDTFLDEVGFSFIKKCLNAVETRGLHEQGLYRVVGVNSKVQKLITIGLDRKKADKLSFEDPSVWETKTITSAVKNYLRSLPEPLMGFKYHDDFIKAAKHESKRLRILDIHKLVHKLPDAQFEMLEILVEHLVKVSNENEKNKMTVANLGVCFGPTLMRPEEETMAAIMDIKFCNIVVEILINNYEEIFGSQPEDVDPSSRKKLRRHWEPAQKSPSSVNSTSSSTTTPTPNLRHNTSTPVLPRDQGATGGGHIYSNQAPIHPSAAGKARLRAVQIYNPNIGGFETHSSTSGSSDSLNGTKPNNLYSLARPATSPQLESRRRGSANSNNSTPLYSNVNNLGPSPGPSPEVFEFKSLTPISPSANRFNFPGADSPTFGSVKKRSSNDFSSSMNSSMPSSMTSSLGSTSLNTSSNKPKRLARALYRCKAENDSELSFEPQQLIHNVRPSREPGWLEGTSCGKTGLLPENYIEYID